MSKDSAARFALLLIAVCVFAPSCEAGRNESTITYENPKLTESTVDFGLQREGAIIEFSLIVDNPTHRPLKVASVSASCGCTVPEVGHSAKVDPNGLLTIPVKWTLPAGPGPKTSNILLSFEDNEEQGRQYSLYAEVPETHPTEFDIGVLGPPPIDKEFAFLITAFPGEQDFSIINTRSSSDSISIIGVEPEESGFRLAVRYSAYAPHQVKEVISIETIDSIQALLNVKITGRVVDYIELEEKVLYLGVASPSEPRSGEMRLLSSPRELSDKLVILDSNFQELSGRGLSVSIDDAEDLALIVTTMPEISEGRVRGTLQREIAKFTWRLGQYRGEAQLEILFLVS